MTDVKVQFRNISRKEYFERKIMELSDAVATSLLALDAIQSAKRPEDKNKIAKQTQYAINLILD